MVMAEREVLESGETKLVIKAVIRKKINFATRPTPLRASTVRKQVGGAQMVTLNTNQGIGEKRR